MTEEKTIGPARQMSARDLQIRQKAKVTATGDGKDWATLPRDERKSYKKAAREALKAEGMLLKRDKQPAELPERPKTPAKLLKM